MAGYGGEDAFDPVEFDGTQEPAPDVFPGHYRGRIGKIEVRATKPKEGDKEPMRAPMLAIEWTVIKALDGGKQQKKCVDRESVITDFVTFFPDDQPMKGRMGKIRYRELCEIFGIKFTAVPKSIRTPADFKNFIKALLNKEAEIWITLKEGDRFARLLLKDPELGADGSPADDDDDAPAEPEDGDPKDDDAEPEEEEEEEEEDDDDADDDAEPEDPAPEPPPPPPTTAKKAKKK